MSANESGKDVVVDLGGSPDVVVMLTGASSNHGVGQGTVETPPPDDDLTLEEAFVIAALVA
jgi:hypothetical protein